MKVDIVELVENEMVELNVAQIGSNWGWGGDENGYGSGYDGDDGGDSHIKNPNFPPPPPLHPTNNDIPLAVTNITTNGNADDIKQVYDSISGRRLVIASKLKGIACYIDESLNSHKRDEINDDNTINETNDDLLL